MLLLMQFLHGVDGRRSCRLGSRLFGDVAHLLAPRPLIGPVVCSALACDTR